MYNFSGRMKNRDGGARTCSIMDRTTVSKTGMCSRACTEFLWWIGPRPSIFLCTTCNGRLRLLRIECLVHVQRRSVKGANRHIVQVVDHAVDHVHHFDAHRNRRFVEHSLRRRTGTPLTLMSRDKRGAESLHCDGGVTVPSVTVPL